MYFDYHESRDDDTRCNVTKCAIVTCFGQVLRFI